MLAYLDHHATTPCDPGVVDAMAPWWTEAFANPASRLYRPALQAAAGVEQARGRIGRPHPERTGDGRFTTAMAFSQFLKRCPKYRSPCSHRERKTFQAKRMMSQHTSMCTPIASTYHLPRPTPTDRLMPATRA